MDKSFYRRERYLKKIEPFVHDEGLIKVISGIRRCGKSCLMETVAQDLIEQGVAQDHVVFLNLDSRNLNKVSTPDELEAAIEEHLPKEDGSTIYLFIDEVQNVEGFETVINAYRTDGGFSIFVTGSNSYLLSGELVTKLTGRYIEIELYTLAFDEFIGMREYLGKPKRSLSVDFQEWLHYGGFPKVVEFDDPYAKARYIEDAVAQIIEKDIRARRRIGSYTTFEKVMTYVINNFAAPTNLMGIANYLSQVEGTPIKRQTVSAYIDVLVQAKILYRCDRFDMKSKLSLQGGEKYYLADPGIYFARNVDATLNYGPLLENVTYTYFCSRDYRMSVGSIGKLEVDFIARRASQSYAYIQVSMSVLAPEVEEREYRPFSLIRDSYPCYLLTLDPLPLQRDGVKGINLMEFMAEGADL